MSRFQHRPPHRHLPQGRLPGLALGYICPGKVRVEYVDQPDEIFSADDFFFVPPGHRPYMLKDTELLQITGKDEVNACGDGASCAGTATKCKCTT